MLNQRIKMRKTNRILSNLVIENNLVNSTYKLIHIKSVIPILFFFMIMIVGTISHINVFNDLSNHGGSCVIGQLGRCNEGEECVELPEEEQLHIITETSFDQRAGICVCPDSGHCKQNNNNYFANEQPKSDQLFRSDEISNSKLALFIGISSSLTLVGVCSFLIYYYGIRYGMIRHFARRLGLFNQNTQVEDNQLLNQIGTNHEEDIELTL